MYDKTMTFSVYEDKEKEMKAILTTVYDALKEKGYRPVDQIIGYLLTEDPTYITSYNGVRHLITKIDRHDLLRDILLNYFQAESI